MAVANPIMLNLPPYERELYIKFQLKNVQILQN